MKSKPNLMILAALACGLVLSSVSVGQDLNIGDQAPALDVEHWVSNGDGNFKEVTEFKEGNVYVVEFWATWCGPCIASMPHLSELQEKHAKNGLQIISISDEDLETVEEFLEGDVRGGEGTYAELTSVYCLTTDPDGESQEQYLQAAGENGIPTAFIVGKDGRIEWIGHPMEIDEPIEAVLNDSWDREAFVAEREKKQADQKIMQEVMSELNELMGDEDTEGALELIDSKIGELESDEAKGFLGQIRLQILMMTGGEEAVKAFSEFVEENKEDSMLLNQIAWAIVEQDMQGEEVDEAMINAAAKAAQFAVDAAPEDGAILDTLAHLLYMQGDLDKAIEVQTKAVKFGGDQAEELQVFLDQLLEEKEEDK